MTDIERSIVNVISDIILNSEEFKECIHKLTNNQNINTDELKELKHKNSLIEQECNHYKHMIKEYEETIEKLNHQIINTDELKELKHKNSLIEQECNHYKHMSNVYEQQITSLNDQITYYKERINELNDTMEKYKEYKELYEGTRKGTHYEEHFFDKLCEYNETYLGNIWSIENVSSNPYSGDFILKHQYTNFTIMIDTKNYSKTVPKREIDKFKRDMKHKDNLFHCGILLSTHNISNKKPYTYEEYSIDKTNKLPSIYDPYLNKSYECHYKVGLYVPNFTFVSIEFFYNILDYLQKQYTRQLQENSTHIQEQTLKEHFKSLASITKKYSTSIQTLNTIHNEMNSLIDTNYKEFSSYNKKIPQTLSKLLEGSSSSTTNKTNKKKSTTTKSSRTSTKNNSIKTYLSRDTIEDNDIIIKNN